MTVNTIQKAERQITVDFSLDEVKKAILIVFENRPSKYMKRDDTINEVFNTYHFPISNNLNPAICDITLNVVSEKKTEVNVVVTNTYGAISSNSILSGILHDYLDVLGKALQGGESAVPKSSGCLVVALLLISSIVLVSFALI
jgi:hypothetical protein